MKRMVSLLIAFAMILSLSVPASIGAENTLHIAVDTLAEGVYPGDGDVKVYVRVPADPVWSAIELRFNFDPQVLTFKSFTLNPELKRQNDEGEMNIYILDKEAVAEGEIGVGFVTVTKVGGYEGYYPAEYDYFGYFTFSVSEEAPLGFSEISLEVCDVKAVVGDIAVNVPFEAENGGVTVGCPHEWETVESKEPTCEDEGFITSRCLLCEEEKTEAVSAIGHKWDEGVTTPPTCTEDGTVFYTCLNDPEHTKTEKGDSLLEHAWEEVEVVAPTCEEGGYTSYVCLNDPEHTKRENEVPSLGHDFGEWEQIKAPSCGGCGEEKRVCKRDSSHVETAEIPALEHEWGEGVATPPTCIEDGYTTFTCLNDANHTKTEKGEAAFGHDFGEWQKLAETTCEKNGKRYRECKNDPEHYEIETIPAFGHAYIESGRQAPTCTEEGWIDYVCENDPSHTFREAVAALGHTRENGKVVLEATCCSVGEMAYTCPVCEVDFTEEIPVDPDAHEWDEVWEIKREPTCSVSGIEICHCILNSEHTNNRPIAPLGHIWGEGVELKAPTCSTEGVVSYTCLRDESHTIVENIAPVPDAHSYVATVVPPTCVDEGYTEHICEYDSEHKCITDPVPANGHSRKAWQIVDFPTCEVGGSLIRYCEVCEESETADLAPLGHDFGDWEQTKAPTPLECGEERRVCKRDEEHFESREIPKLDNMPGDMDSDMVITVADALALLRIAAGMSGASELETAIGDLDFDGQITVADSLAVLRTAAGFLSGSEEA